jgi:AhpD family alkylhydroperoxidase
VQWHIRQLVSRLSNVYSRKIAGNGFENLLAAQEEQMSEHYHDAGDLRFLKEMGKLAPTEFKAWLTLDRIVAREDGAIPRKYRELIALGVAFTTQCPYCIEGHVKGAKAAGATREEIAESSLIAAALRAGGAATHGAMALKFYDQV